MIAIDNTLFEYFTVLIPICMAVTLIVLKAGASRVMFDVIGTFQANRLISDARAASTVFQALMLDAITGVQESGQAIGEQFSQMMNSMIPVAREIENARVELEKFLNVSDGFGPVEKDVQDIGYAYGFAADEAFSAAARMAQLTGVLGQGTMGVGTETGMQFGLISGMETSAAMQRMINLQQQTKFMTHGIEENATQQERIDGIRINSIKVLDQLNTVENRSAATMEQITYVMNQFAAQAHLTGESIASMAAMSATLIEAGEEQGKGGRALRMIYARLGANTGGAADAFHELGIATHDEEENLRSLSDIMKDLNKIYPDLQEHQRTALAQQVAGNRHYTRFLKLSENMDRTLELEFEALMRLSPAMEEIERRRNANIFLLEQSEARLKNMSGAIGNALIPALTEATHRQADFNQEIAMFLGSKYVGGATTRLAGFGQMMSDMIGPMFNMLVNLQMLKVATSTYTTVVRALSGEELINQDAYGNKTNAYAAGTAQMMHYEDGIQNIINALAMEAHALTIMTEAEQEAAQKRVINIFSIKQELESHEDVIRTLTAETKARIDLLNIQKIGHGNSKSVKLAKQELAVISQTSTIPAMKAELEAKLSDILADDISIQTKEEVKNAINRVTEALNAETHALSLSGLAKEIESEKQRKIMMQSEGQQAAMMTRYSSKLMIMGTASIFFGKSQKTMRYGMVANTLAMVIQMFSMRAKTKAQQVDNLVKGEAVVLNWNQVISLGALKVAQDMVAKSMTRMSATIAASATVVRTAIPELILLGAAVIIIVEGLEMLGILGDTANLDLENLDSNTRTFSSSTGQLIDMLKDEANTIDSLTVSIADKEKQIKTLGKVESVVTKAKLDALTTELNTEKDLLDIKRAQLVLTQKEAGTSNASAENYFELVKKMGDLEKKYGKSGQGTGIFGGGVQRLTNRMWNDLQGGFVEDWHKQILNTEEEYDIFISENENLHALLSQRNIEGLEEWNAFLDGVADGLVIISNAEAQALGIMSNEYTMAAESLQKFSNMREELFYGFSSANLTGNLVKQVVQQGVETLITTTEVIMSNTFNGMTTSQAASQILDEIERGAGLRGMNLSSSN